MLRAGWTDSNKQWKRAHKFNQDNYHPLCGPGGLYEPVPEICRFRDEAVSYKPPKNACGNCLRIDKANKEKEGR